MHPAASPSSQAFQTTNAVCGLLHPLWHVPISAKIKGWGCVPARLLLPRLVLDRLARHSDLRSDFLVLVSSKKGLLTENAVVDQKERAQK
jgi:hypothetical protein